MNIAQELDAKEQVLMQELGNDTNDYRKYMSVRITNPLPHKFLLTWKEESGNVGVDGNFSVEVIKKALHVFNLVSTPLNHPEMKEASNQPQYVSLVLVPFVPSYFYGKKIVEQR